MRLTIGVPALGCLDRLKSTLMTCLATLDRPAETELILIDQDEKDRWKEWLRHYAGRYVGSVKCIQTDRNLGVPKAHNLIAEKASAETIAYLHTDVIIYDQGWDSRVLRLYEEEDRLGVIGFAGARGVAANGSRYEFWSNMLEAEVHGSRGGGVLPVAMLDGFCLIIRKACLKELGGWDVHYPIHHYYDYDICTMAHLMGFRNLLVGVRCHHLSGVTNATKAYNDQADRLTGQTGGKGGSVLLHQAHARYLQKFGPQLPVFVPDWYNGRKKG